MGGALLSIFIGALWGNWQPACLWSRSSWSESRQGSSRSRRWGVVAIGSPAGLWIRRSQFESEHPSRFLRADPVRQAWHMTKADDRLPATVRALFPKSASDILAVYAWRPRDGQTRPDRDGWEHLPLPVPPTRDLLIRLRAQGFTWINLQADNSASPHRDAEISKLL